MSVFGFTLLRATVVALIWTFAPLVLGEPVDGDAGLTAFFVVLCVLPWTRTGALDAVESLLNRLED